MDDPIELKLELFAGGPLHTVQGDLGGKPTFLFDTGGGITGPSTTREQLGCPVFGRGTGFRHDGTRVDGPRGGPVDVAFGNYRRRAELARRPLCDAAGPAEGRWHRVPRDVRRPHGETVDMAHDRVVLETASSFAARIQGAAELKVRIGNQAGGASLDLFVAIEGNTGHSGSKWTPATPSRS